MILANSKEVLNLFILTNIVINFAFHKEEDLYKGIYRVLEG